MPTDARVSSEASTRGVDLDLTPRRVQRVKPAKRASYPSGESRLTRPTPNCSEADPIPHPGEGRKTSSQPAREVQRLYGV